MKPARIPARLLLAAGLRAPHFDIPQVLPTLTDKAVEVLHQRAQHKEQPFFLYFAMPSPHTPWVPPRSTRANRAPVCMATT